LLDFKSSNTDISEGIDRYIITLAKNKPDVYCAVIQFP